MPLIIAQNQNTAADGYLLSGYEDILVETGITIHSTAASGILAGSGGHVFTIEGTVRGFNDGITMLGADATCTVIVQATGVVEAYGSADPANQSNGVLLDGLHSNLDNAGTISGAYSAVTGIIQGTVTMLNSGTLTGGVYGIYAPFGTGELRLTNSGSITGPTAISGATGVDRIVNSGTITGAITLRDGNDSLHTTGTILGPINLGAGNDRFTDASTLLSNHDSVLGQGGNDTLRGGLGQDTLRGESGLDLIYGGEGADLLDGGNDADTLYAGNDSDLIYGGSGHDLISGGAGADTLRGGSGDDVLQGNSGADRLNGGSGADQFVFHYPSNGQDIIEDFTASADRLVFEGGAFGYGEATGQIDSSHCVFDAAQDGNDHWIYVRASKTLFFDSNGSGAGGRYTIATFSDANGMEGWNLWLI